LWILCGLSLGLAVSAAPVPPAEEYFHQGATNYVFGRIKEALTAVESGLEKFQGDPKLKMLEELLKQEQQKQDQQSKEDEKKDQDKKDQDKKDQQSKEDQQKQQQQQDQQKKDGQDKEQQKKSEEGQKPDDKKPEDQQSKEGSADKDKKEADSKQGQKPEGDAGKPDDKDMQAARVIPGQMTPQEAHRLLDAQRAQEQAMIFLPQVRTSRVDRVLKDW
jgi:hypothetical protein